MTGYEKLRYTVVLTAGVQSQAGQWKAVKLPPMIIFKNLKKAPKGKFPPGMVVTCTKDGTMTRELMMASYLKLFKGRLECFFEQKESLLIMDTAASHTVEVVKTELTKLNTDIKFIEGGMAPLLQVMDTHVNKSFKDILKNRWAEWLDHGEEEFTRTGKRSRDSYEMTLHLS